MAGPLGGKGRRVATRAALWDALLAAEADQSSWHLIEIMIPRNAYSGTLTRFVEASKKHSALAKGA
jgi:indolepyruvate decarboxylase